jgi:hypothetical protein
MLVGLFGVLFVQRQKVLVSNVHIKIVEHHFMYVFKIDSIVLCNHTEDTHNRNKEVISFL